MMVEQKELRRDFSMTDGSAVMQFYDRLFGLIFSYSAIIVATHSNKQ